MPPRPSSIERQRSGRRRLHGRVRSALARGALLDISRSFGDHTSRVDRMRPAPRRQARARRSTDDQPEPAHLADVTSGPIGAAWRPTMRPFTAVPLTCRDPQSSPHRQPSTRVHPGHRIAVGDRRDLRRGRSQSRRVGLMVSPTNGRRAHCSCAMTPPAPVAFASVRGRRTQLARRQRDRRDAQPRDRSPFTRAVAAALVLDVIAVGLLDQRGMAARRRRRGPASLSAVAPRQALSPTAAVSRPICGIHPTSRAVIATPSGASPATKGDRRGTSHNRLSPATACGTSGNSPRPAS